MNRYLTFDDVLIVPKYSEVDSRKAVSLTTSIAYSDVNVIALPIISANMESVTDAAMCRHMYNLGGVGCLHRYMSVEDNVANAKALIREGIFFIASIGAKDFIRFDSLYKAGVRHYCIDMAHGHCLAMKEMIYKVKRAGAYVIAGNIATANAALDLKSWGADMVKVGIGPGGACTTREQTGIGVPQLSALMEIAKTRVPFIADGGCRKPGDVAKALATGARFVMLGSMLAGCDESPAPLKQEFICSYPRGYMRDAGKVYKGSASQNNESYKTEEGVEVCIPSTGPLIKTLNNIAGGVRSAMSYVGASNLEEFVKNAEFIEITSNAYLEGKPHARNL